MVAMYFLKPEIIFNLIMKFLQSGLREKTRKGNKNGEVEEERK